jgi:tetratricopeptide (TPR) repeat protein
LKSIQLALCFFILCTFCTGEDAGRYFDNLGVKLYSARNYSEAQDYFNMSLQQNSSNPDAWAHMGDTERALQDYNASLDSYNLAIEIDGQKASAWSGLADAYSAKKDYANASAAAGKLPMISPKNKGYWLKAGTLLQMEGNFSGAESSLDRALALDANYKDALYRKALSKMAANLSDQAVELLDKVIALDPKYKQAYNAKGQALEMQGSYDAALKAYERALRIDPKWNVALINKMNALLESGRQKEAVDLLLRL